MPLFSQRAAGGLTVYNAVAMNLSKTARLLLAIASGAALALAFPLFHFSLLGWIAPAMLIVAVLGATPRLALLLGLLQGLVFYGFSVPWFYTVMRQYGPLPVAQAGGVFLLVVLVLSLFHAVFGLGVAWLGRGGAARACLAAPFLWVAMEFGITHMPDIGFPWNLLGYVAAGNLAFVQMTAITGIFGLSLVVAGYNAMAVWALMQFRDRKLGGVKLWIGATAALIVIGLAGPRFVPQTVGDHVAHLVQTNFPVSNGYPVNWMTVHAGEMDQLEQISIGAAQKIPGIVVWPEVPAPFSLQDANFLVRAQRIARGAGNGFLVGVIDWKPLPDGKIGASNSAALLDSAGAENFLYDKIHLVPFSEYVPWRSYLGFAGSITSLIGDFQHGSQYKVGRMAGEPFSVFICYEAIFPNEVRRFTLAGADVLINISDDGWFGGSGAPEQHLAMARVRAVENRRWLLRDTNDGITVSVDPYGRIAAQLAPDIRGELDAPYGFRTDLTPYARWGDWLPWLCALAALVLLLFGTRKGFARDDK
ncbi:MAG: apolipoprotein N-acyltransferase [Acidobacteriia bacterium]|nr:apolipoprotein N-acyltransferase [Terriglobia bacterium]